MRQVGVLCAAAYVALRDNVPKLADDHRRAKILAGSIFLMHMCLFLVNLVIETVFFPIFPLVDGLQQVEYFSVDSNSVESNMVGIIFKSKLSYAKITLHFKNGSFFRYFLI
jgi:threonine aldolase